MISAGRPCRQPLEKQQIEFRRLADQAGQQGVDLAAVVGHTLLSRKGFVLVQLLLAARPLLFGEKRKFQNKVRLWLALRTIKMRGLGLLRRQPVKMLMPVRPVAPFRCASGVDGKQSMEGPLKGAGGTGAAAIEEWRMQDKSVQFQQ